MTKAVEFLVGLRYSLAKKLNPVVLQVVGLLSIPIAFVLFGRGHPYLGWFVVLAPVTGGCELLLMFVWGLTITGFGRSLFKRKIDLIIGLFAAVPVTWWLFGPTAAGMYFIGWLSNHFGEKQTRETIF